MPNRRTSTRGATGKNTMNRNEKNATGPKAGQELAEVDFGKLPGYIGYQVRQAQSAVFRDLSRSLRQTGVTPGEVSLLAMLSANPRLNPTRPHLPARQGDAFPVDQEADGTRTYLEHAPRERPPLLRAGVDKRRAHAAAGRDPAHRAAGGDQGAGRRPGGR